MKTLATDRALVTAWLLAQAGMPFTLNGRPDAPDAVAQRPYLPHLPQLASPAPARR
jgi:hypothetical protein